MPKDGVLPFFKQGLIHGSFLVRSEGFNNRFGRFFLFRGNRGRKSRFSRLSATPPGTHPASLQQTVPGLENNARAAVRCLADIHKPRPFLCVLHVLNGGPNPLRCALKDNLSFPKGRRAFGPVDLGVSLKYSSFSVFASSTRFSAAFTSS